MPSDGERGIVTTPMHEEHSQELSILLQRVLGTDEAPALSAEQVDELLSQKREITRYIHEDRERESADNKWYFAGILLFILIFSGLVLKQRPDLFSEVLSFLAGLFGGGLGGYGFASKKKVDM